MAPEGDAMSEQSHDKCVLLALGITALLLADNLGVRQKWTDRDWYSLATGRREADSHHCRIIYCEAE